MQWHPGRKNDEYYRDYLHRGLDIIDPADLKAYFLHRKAISLVVQLRIEQAHAGGVLKPERAVLLREALAELYRAGLGNAMCPPKSRPASQGVSSDGRGTRVPGVGRGRSCPAAADHPAATAPGTQGTLYFCTLPSGLRFDLYAGLDGTLQCWRLVDGSRWEKDRRMECRDPSRNGPAVGVEPTGEGTLRIYAEQHIDPEEPDPEKKILKLLRGYAELISAPEMQHLGAVNCWVIHIARQSWYTGTRKKTKE